MARLALQAAARTGTVTLLRDYATSVGLKTGRLYRARPLKGVLPPDIYIDRITEGADDFVREESQRTVRVAIRVLWGMYDAGEAVDQRDRFVDGFYAHVMDNRGAFDANAMVTWVGVADDPAFRPEWVEGSESFYMTEIVLEGFAAT